VVRWDGQQLGAEDDAALPGLSRIPGLVRSVTTPEFAGVTFHEVRARSVLNEVPGQSLVPFRWTVNPYRGCTHACTYCLSGDTLVMLASGRVRRLADVRVGDRVYGTEESAGVRRYVATEVRAHWETVKAGIAVELDDGAVLVASGDHRFLTPTGWKHVAPGACAAAASRPYLVPGDDLVGLGREQVGRSVGSGGQPIADDARRRVVRVEPVGSDLPMYDLTTGTGDFVANGVVSHNCFARASHSWLELDTGQGFDTEIVVKVNAAEVLAREVGRRSWTHEHVALGTNTDPYQRAEGRYRLMPGIITALARSGTPFSVLSKGTLLKRDLPLLAEASRSVSVGLGVSIAIYDGALHASLEPGTPSPRARLDLVRAIRAAGFDCGVLLAPVLPRLTDSAEQLESAVTQLADAGATGVTVIPLHLRPGAREWFMAWLARERPDLVPAYERLYARGSYVTRDYREWLSRRVQPLLARHGLDGSAPVRDGAADSAPAAAGPPSPRQLSLL
jgi:DNA repair photolyase